MWTAPRIAGNRHKIQQVRPFHGGSITESGVCSMDLQIVQGNMNNQMYQQNVINNNIVQIFYAAIGDGFHSLDDTVHPDVGLDYL